MFRNFLALLIIVSVGRVGWAAPSDEPSEMLARAEALYYEADFAKSVDLLLRADELLRQQSGPLQESIAVKLQLALGFIGMNDSTRARTYLEQLYALDSEHYIDPKVFSPKIIRLAEEAKLQQNELRCRSLLDETKRQLGSGNADAVVELIGSSQAKCSGFTALYPEAAELIFKQGLEAYKKAQMTKAMQEFRTVLDLEPEHELAAQYIDLTKSKLEIAADRAFLAWRKDFNAGEFAFAARDYRELMASVTSLGTIDEVRMEYRRALSSLVDSWNRACMNDDAAAMEQVRLQVTALLPEPSFGEDIIAKMTTCTHTGCIQMSAQMALTRLKNRVDPHFASFVASQIRDSPVTVRVKARISEKGDAATIEMHGGNPLVQSPVRDAFDQWKFFPAVVQGEARCVDTEIPIVISFTKN